MTYLSHLRDTIPWAGNAAAARRGWLEPLLLALAATLFVTVMGLLRSADTGIPNSDDLVRLVEVRDLLAGQGWFDLTQYRLGLDAGTAMHWSRLVDAPVAVLVAFWTAVTGSAAAGEAAAKIIWPAFTLFAAMMALMFTCARTGHEAHRLPVAVIGAMALWSIGVFAPGALDHHNIQIALALWLLALLLPGRFPVTSSASAGIVAVLMLAIGMEALPYVVLAGVIVVTGFTMGMIAPVAARAFGIAVAATTATVFVATVGPRNYDSAACDAFSAFHFIAGTTGGVGLAVLSYVPGKLVMRSLGVAGLGALLLAAVVLFFPHCLENPLASLDPRLRTFWLEGVVETRSLADLWASDPYSLFGLYGLAVTAMLVASATILANSGRNRRSAIVFAAFLATGIAVTAWQQRGFTFATAFAILPLGFWIGHMRAMTQDTSAVARSFAMAGAWIVSINIFWWLLGAQAASLFSGGATLQQQAAAASARDYCYTADLYAPLAAEPEGVVLGATDIGPGILLYTGHRAIAGPYHRNTAGNLLLIEAMLARPAMAQTLLRKNGVTLIADCIHAADAADFIEASPSGLQAVLRSRRLPAWLEPVAGTQKTPMVLYRVIE